MSRVSPEAADTDDQSAKYHHHVPNEHHFNDVADGKNKQVLVNFEKYTLRESEDQIKQRIPGRSNDPEGKSRRRRRRSKDRADRSNPDPQPTPPSSAPPTNNQPNISKQPGRRFPKFLQCDTIAYGIILAYVLCIAVFIMGLWCYLQDSSWNEIVIGKRPFPTLANEDFFGGKYLYIYEEDEGLRQAKKFLLRENRWLELMHLLFMSGFLILTVFQLAAYLTRADENHNKLIICYYTVFGGLGLLVAVFPLFSWYNQESNYRVSAHYLQDFSARQWKVGRKYYKKGLTNATAHDSWTVGAIMKFCYDASQDGLTIDKDTRYFAFLKRRYQLSQMQYLGFCTHHKYKIVTTIFSTIFALVCCAIPCIYFFRAGEPAEPTEITVKVHVVDQGTGAEGPPPGMQYDEEAATQGDLDRRARPSGDAEDYPEHKSRSHYTGEGGRHLTKHERNEIEKFKRYIEGEDQG